MRLNLVFEESKLVAGLIEGVRNEGRVQRSRKTRNEPVRKRRAWARQGEALWRRVGLAMDGSRRGVEVREVRGKHGALKVI